MFFVDNCPTNQAEIAKASKRLECKNDTYGNNQYICVPNVEISSLVEFCFDGIMGIHKKNNCVAAAGQSLFELSCLNFSSGCPQKHYWSYQFYKHPACQNINTEHHCYVMDPSCLHYVPDEDTGHHDTNNPAWIIIAVSVLVVLIIANACFFIFRKIHKKLTREPLNGSQRDGHKSSDRLSDFITSIESFFKYRKDKEHTDHDCEPYLIREDRLSDFITSMESLFKYRKDKEHTDHDCEPYLIREDKEHTDHDCEPYLIREDA